MLQNFQIFPLPLDQSPLGQEHHRQVDSRVVEETNVIVLQFSVDVESQWFIELTFRSARS